MRGRYDPFGCYVSFGDTIDDDDDDDDDNDGGTSEEEDKKSPTPASAPAPAPEPAPEPAPAEEMLEETPWSLALAFLHDMGGVESVIEPGLRLCSAVVTRVEEAEESPAEDTTKSKSKSKSQQQQQQRNCDCEGAMAEAISSLSSLISLFLIDPTPPSNALNDRHNDRELVNFYRARDIAARARMEQQQQQQQRDGGTGAVFGMIGSRERSRLLPPITQIQTDPMNLNSGSEGGPPPPPPPPVMFRPHLPWLIPDAVSVSGSTPFFSRGESNIFSTNGGVGGAGVGVGVGVGGKCKFPPTALSIVRSCLDLMGACCRGNKLGGGVTAESAVSALSGMNKMNRLEPLFEGCAMIVQLVLGGVGGWTGGGGGGGGGTGEENNYSSNSLALPPPTPVFPLSTLLPGPTLPSLLLLSHPQQLGAVLRCLALTTVRGTGGAGGGGGGQGGREEGFELLRRRRAGQVEQIGQSTVDENHALLIGLGEEEILEDVDDYDYDCSSNSNSNSNSIGNSNSNSNNRRTFLSRIVAMLRLVNVSKWRKCNAEYAVQCNAMQCNAMQ